MFYIAAGVVNHTRNKKHSNESKIVINENESSDQCPMHSNNTYSVSINIPIECEKNPKNPSITLSPEYLRDVNLWMESFSNGFEERRQLAQAIANIDRSMYVIFALCALHTSNLHLLASILSDRYPAQNHYYSAPIKRCIDDVMAIRLYSLQWLLYL